MKHFLRLRKTGKQIISLALVTAVVGSFSLLGGCGSGEKALKATTKSTVTGKQLIDIKFGVGNTGTGGILPVIAAEANYDEEFGLNFILQPVDNASDTLAATSAGKITVGGWSSAAPLSYIAKGNKLTIIGGLMSDYESLITTKANKDKWTGKLTADFLKGKKIAVNRTNSGDIALRAYFASQGINLKTIQYQELDSGTSVIEAVNKGVADAGIVNGGFYRPAEKQGLINVRFIKNIIGRDFICCRQLVRPDSLKTNRDVYVKVEEALIKAYQLYKTNPDKTVEFASHYLKLSKDDIKFLTYDYGDLLLSPDPDIQGVYNYFDGMKRCGYIDANSKVDITKYVDTSIYRDALDTLLKQSPNDTNLLTLKKDFKGTIDKTTGASANG